MDWLRVNSSKITAFRVLGIAASAATIISSISKNVPIEVGLLSLWMVHNAQGQIYGDARDFDQFAEILRQTDRGIKTIYRNTRNLPADYDLDEAMNNETWLVGENIVEEGWAEGLYDPSIEKDKDKDRDDEPAEDLDALELLGEVKVEGEVNTEISDSSNSAESIEDEVSEDAESDENEIDNTFSVIYSLTR